MRRLFGALALALLLAPLALGQVPKDPAVEPGKLTIDFLDVGQGDAVLLRSPEGRTALIDAGPSKRVVSQLEALGVNSIDLVAVSHHHADHYGGMAAVIARYQPRFFLATDSPHATALYLRLLRTVQAARVRAIFPTEAARRIELGSAVLSVLPQPPTDPDDENDNSIGIRVQYGTFSALLTGDSQDNERAWWARRCPELVANVQVLKLAHHGSKNGIGPAWLRLTAPRLAVCSVGATNDYGHPSPLTLALVARQGVRLMRTDLDGTIEVQSDGRTWSVVQRHLATRGPPDGKDQRRPEKGGTSGLVNINTASLAELEALPGIGKALARRIVEGRPYATVDELERVPGIGPKRMAEILALICIN